MWAKYPLVIPITDKYFSLAINGSLPDNTDIGLVLCKDELYGLLSGSQGYIVRFGWLIISKVCASKQGGPFLQVQANPAFQDDGTGQVFPRRKNNFATTGLGTLVNGFLNNGCI